MVVQWNFNFHFSFLGEVEHLLRCLAIFTSLIFVNCQFMSFAHFLMGVWSSPRLSFKELIIY